MSDNGITVLASHQTRHHNRYKPSRRSTLSFNITAHTMHDQHGQRINFKQFENQAILLINTASLCGFRYQVAQLTQLSQDFSHKPFHIILVPSNDFGQEKSDPSQNICYQLHSPRIHVMAQTSIIGPHAHPLFQQLQSEVSWLARTRWNFYKYLFDTNGQLHSWFSPLTPPAHKKVLKNIDSAILTT